VDRQLIDNIVFDDVFEAMRRLDKSNPILNLKDKAQGYLKRNLRFNLMELPDGTIGAFPANMMLRFYRGENQDFDSRYRCVPKIYRINKPEEKDLVENRNDDYILIDNLKMTEFELVTKEFPQVKYAIEDYCNVDYKALAQHYDLNTDLLDMSSDIAVAAFFATHTYDCKNGYQVKTDGIGCLRVYIQNFINSKSELAIFRLIGLQPFQRPGLQCAFALRMNKDEDFSRLSGKALFMQNAKWNRKLHEAFCAHGRNILFPLEDIDDAAMLIKSSNHVSEIAIRKFCKENDFTEEYIERVLSKHKIQISERLTYSLSRQQRRRLEREFKGRPYGDVELRSRIAF